MGAGWKCFQDVLSLISNDELTATVRIRGIPDSAINAIHDSSVIMEPDCPNNVRHVVDVRSLPPDNPGLESNKRVHPPDCSELDLDDFIHNDLCYLRPVS